MAIVESGGWNGEAAASSACANDVVGRAAARVYAALDLGTNNCRLLIARPAAHGFRVVDSFSRIVRLGEGLSQTGRLSPAAIARTIEALDLCRAKIEQRQANRLRLIATQACRGAENGRAFIDLVRERTGLSLDIVDRESEALLAAEGCAALADPLAQSVVLFDIGGGSSEIVWLDGARGLGLRQRVREWASLRLGVVSLAERFGGASVSAAVFDAMVAFTAQELAPFARAVASLPRCPRFHLLGTSGTVTTLAGVHLELARYDRRRVDGLWMTCDAMDAAVDRLRAMSYDERAANGCIGAPRADLVLAGAAIMEAIRLAFPARRIRIADRGLREGLLMQMMRDDGVWAGGSEMGAL